MRASKITFITAGLSAVLILAACGDRTGAPKTLLGSNYTYWKITDAAQNAYPSLAPMEARKRYVQDKFTEMSASLTPEQQRSEAASFYAGYMMLNAVAIPQYCANMNVDITPFADGFKRKNSGSETSLDAVLESQGITRDQVWKKMERYAMSNAKNELMSAGGLRTGSRGVCSAIRKDPNTFLGKARFGQHFPVISSALNTDPR